MYARVGMLVCTHIMLVCTRTRSVRKQMRRATQLSYYAKRYKSGGYISVNNNTNLKFFKILSIYTIWNGLSLKTISRY
jgi:hypothetical protein